jgi:hypothetical protein
VFFSCFFLVNRFKTEVGQHGCSAPSTHTPPPGDSHCFRSNALHGPSISRNGDSIKSIGLKKGKEDLFETRTSTPALKAPRLYSRSSFFSQTTLVALLISSSAQTEQRSSIIINRTEETGNTPAPCFNCVCACVFVTTGFLCLPSYFFPSTLYVRFAPLLYIALFVPAVSLLRLFFLALFFFCVCLFQQQTNIFIIQW